MRYTPQINIKSRQASKIIIVLAVLLCLITIAGFFLSEMYFLTHANHEHDHNGVGGGCATCAQIQNTENFLKQFGMSAGGASFASIYLFGAISFLCCISFLFGCQTPVKLKIKMNK